MKKKNNEDNIKRLHKTENINIRRMTNNIYVSIVKNT